MVFIDADKGGYEAYYEACLTVPGLLAEGGVIVVDNVLFKGQAYRPRLTPTLSLSLSLSLTLTLALALNLPLTLALALTRPTARAKPPPRTTRRGTTGAPRSPISTPRWH